LGTEEVVVRDGTAYWVVEKPSWTGLWDYTVEELEIGSVDDEGRLHLGEDYGGGCMPLEEAQGIAENTFYLGRNPWPEPRILRRVIHDALHGEESTSTRGVPSQFEAWRKGFQEGQDAGAVVIADYATSWRKGRRGGGGDWLYNEAQRVQAEFDDPLSQVGFGFGKFGVDCAYAAAFVRVAGPAIGRGLAALGRAGPWVARGMALYLGYQGARHTVTAVEAGMAGDYSTMVHAGGDAALEYTFAGALLHWSGARAAQLSGETARPFAEQMSPQEAARYESYWENLTRPAPEQSRPYDIRTTYTVRGEVESYTTYDAYGNRAFQYEVHPGVRHGEGYHVYDNYGRHSGSGKGPRGSHLPYDYYD